MNDDRILVAVFDSAHARFFEFKPQAEKLVSVLEDMKSGLDHDRRDINTDKPGRGFSSGDGGQRHAYESHSDVRKLEKHDFVRAVARAVEAALDQHAFGRLVIVAPERSVGEFRSVANENAKKAIWREVPKELANLSDPALSERLIPLLQSLSG